MLAPWMSGILGRQFSECLGLGSHLLTHFLYLPALSLSTRSGWMTPFPGQKASKRVRGKGTSDKRMRGLVGGGLAEEWSAEERSPQGHRRPLEEEHSL